jgi:hypothetical protein
MDLVKSKKTNGLSHPSVSCARAGARSPSGLAGLAGIRMAPGRHIYIYIYLDCTRVSRTNLVCESVELGYVFVHVVATNHAPP